MKIKRNCALVACQGIAVVWNHRFKPRVSDADSMLKHRLPRTVSPVSHRLGGKRLMLSWGSSSMSDFGSYFGESNVSCDKSNTTRPKGNVAVKVDPRVSFESTSNLPPRMLVVRLTIESPRPVPSVVGSSWEKGSKIECRRKSEAIPLPPSASESLIEASSTSMETRTQPVGSPNFNELS